MRTRIVAGYLSAVTPTMSPDSWGHTWSLLVHLTRLQLRETVKNVFFLVLVLAALLFVLAQVLNGEATYGAKTYPVTYLVLELVEQGFSVFIVIITAFYAGGSMGAFLPGLAWNSGGWAACVAMVVAVLAAMAVIASLAYGRVTT